MFTRLSPRRLPFLVVFAAIVTFTGGVAEAAKRVALLIGNQEYQATTALKNPENDVNLMRKTLEDAGFDDVVVALNVDLVGMKKALRSFEDKAYGAEVAVLYYSGHGIEMNGTNYLIPTDAVLKSDRDVEDEALALDRAERSLNGATRLKLVILDACRNNPFLDMMQSSSGTSRSVQKGLAKVEPEGADTLVAYASRAGTVALDGSGANSPFAEALAKYIAQPGVDIRIALGQVRDEVVKITQRKQEPFVYGSLGGAQIYLSIKELNVTVNNNNVTPDDKKEEVAPNGISSAAADWQNIKDLADKELLEAFIAKHGADPVYKMLAEKKLKLLAAAEAKADVSADQIAWEALKGSTDLAAIKRFIERYPDSQYKKEAERGHGIGVACIGALLVPAARVVIALRHAEAVLGGIAHRGDRTQVAGIGATVVIGERLLVILLDANALTIEPAEIAKRGGIVMFGGLLVPADRLGIVLLGAAIAVAIEEGERGLCGMVA